MGFVDRKFSEDISGWRRWRSTVRSIVILLSAIGLVLIWAPELQAFALSIAAVAVAIVVALKEAIMCLIGAFVRATEKPFRVGDYIEIKGVSGEVVDIGMMHFSVHEYEMSTGEMDGSGRVVMVPNSVLLIENFSRETFGRYISNDSFCFEIPASSKWSDIARNLEAEAAAHFGAHNSLLMRFRMRMSKVHQIDIPIIRPKVMIEQIDIEKIRLRLVMSVPRKSRDTISDELTRWLLGELVK